MKYNLLFTIIFASALMSEPSTYINSDVHFYDIHHLSDFSIINIPFRILTINLDHQNGDFAFNSTMAMEYRPRKDNSYFIKGNQQEFFWDLREMYLSWFTSFGEIKVGKQIHSWSSVDDNSPIDNINAYDYYYIFNLGTDRKLGSLGLTLDYYFNNSKLGMYYSPLHHTNRLPINDPDFPIQLPVTPRANQIISPKRADEYGFTLQQKMNLADLSLTYFSGYDRLFSLSGSNVFTNQFQTVSVLDTVYSFRKTSMIGAGIVIPTDWFVLRAEFAQFETRDVLDSNDIRRAHPEFPNIYTDIIFSHAFKTKAKYYQAILQLETELPGNIEFVGQYIQYDTLSFYSKNLPDVDLPLLEASFDPYSVFYPGMGTPLTILAKDALLMIFSKSFFNEQLLIETLILSDQSTEKEQKGTGKLVELKGTYDMTSSLKLISAITYITGNSQLGNEYMFNKLENFSHLRFEIKYFF